MPRLGPTLRLASAKASIPKCSPRKSLTGTDPPKGRGAGPVQPGGAIGVLVWDPIAPPGRGQLTSALTLPGTVARVWGSNPCDDEGVGTRWTGRGV